MTKLQIAVMVGSAKLHLAGIVILLGLVFLSTAHSATYYVKPNSANATCPPSESPCLTLTEYGRIYDQYFNVSDIQLKLLPGIHVLEVNFTVANIQHIQLLGNLSSTEVLCTDDVGITFENVSGLTIDGLMFTSCGTHLLSYEYALSSYDYARTYLHGLLIDSVQNTMITNCTFQNSSGTALAVVNSSALLGNTSFLGNCKNRSVYSCSEGGILAVESSLNFTGTTLFSRNIGGGISACKHTTVNMNGNTTFIHNTANSRGGICAYTTYSTSGGEGGGISAAEHTTVNMKGNTNFVNNSALYGGGIYAFRHTTVNFNGNTTFVNNSAVSIYVFFDITGYIVSNGGGISANEHTTVNMNGSITFVNNSAEDCGGICAFRHTTVNLNGNTTFVNNSAVHSVDGDGTGSGEGGGIGVSEYTTLNMNGNTTFVNNSARDGGGIHAFRHTTANFNGNTTFVNNSARDGGGIRAFRHTTVNFNGNTTFVNNSARDGGGISAYEHTTVNMNGTSTFISNFGGGGGGIHAAYKCTVYLEGNSCFWSNWGHNGGAIGVHESVLTMKGNHTFTKCWAAVEGGAVYMNKSRVTFIGETVISHNRAMDGGGGIYAQDSTLAFPDSANFVSNLARRGGGIYSSFSEIKASGICKICSNLAHLDGGGVYSDSSTFRFSGNNTLNNNQAQIGAGIYLDNSTMNLARNSDVEENVAIFYGAGIYARRTLLNLTGNNALQRNTAMKEGGAIYATANSTLNFNGNNTFTGSVANVSGGAVWLENSILNLDSNITFRNCRAEYEGGAIYAYDSHMKVGGKCTFISNNATRGGGVNLRWSSLSFYSGSVLKVLNNSAVTGGGIFSDNSTLEFNETCTFQANFADTDGAGLYAARSNLRFFGTSYFHYNQATENGGGIYARESSHITLCGINNFEDNFAEKGGGVALEDSSLMDTISSCFASQCSVTTVAVNSFNINQAKAIGGGIFALYGTLTLQGKNMFNGNTANMTGGGMYAFDSSLHFPGEITFTNNSAVQYGGGLATVLCKLVNMSGYTNMKWNSAHCGGAMYIDESTVNIDESTNMEWNSAYRAGVMYIDHSRVDIDGNNCFHENNATSEGGVIYVMKSIVNLNGTNTFKTSMTKERGGTFFITSSNLTFNGNNLFQHSVSLQGAAICAFHSNLTFQGNMIFSSNTAKYGGAIQLLKSNLVFANHSHHTSIGREPEQTNCQRGSKTGNGTGNCFPQGNSFVNNTAHKGGALYLDQSSEFYLDPASPLHFKCNVAIESGGAIYVEDVGQHLPGLNSPFRTECFFHILMGQQATHADLKLSFQNNSAGRRGSVLYGGLLNKCNFSSVIPYTNTTSAVDIFSGFILYDNETSSISSDPTEVCFCSNNRTECGEKTQTRSVFAGQHFDVSVLAVDQVNVSIPTIFYAVLNNENRSYIIANYCTKEEYTFTSANYVNQIKLYPSSVSGETIELTVNITLQDCPPGFQLLNSSGKCDCDHKLQQFTDNCDINKQAVWRTGQGAGNFWVGVSYNNGTYDGLILHRNCPLNYCTRRRKWIHLNDSSEQCDFNRTGLLCSQCREGESSIFGNSQCRRCGNKHLFLLFPFAIAGVSLVVLLFLLNLTVAAGTIHGLIFYANIIAANHHIFLLQDQSKVFTVFISWLNLDLGIETCFYNGMDTFFKTCLQFVFPLYVWALVGALVYISHHSLLVSKLLGTNTIPVLATLFFLSYAKILRIIFVALSLTSLNYPGGEKTVWLYDANISSLWYIPLAVAAALFLLFLFLPYTFLLLLGQWLQVKSYLWVLSWANNLNMKAFLDAYHAPYKLKHRYWTGLLLLLRCGLYLVFASNVSGEPSVNLLAISLAVLGVTVTLLFTGRVYKNWTLNALEVSFIVNLGILAAATYHVTVVNQKDNIQVYGSQVATYISISVTFLTFLGILLYHIYLQIKSKIRKFKLNANQIHCKVNFQPEDQQDLEKQPLIAPTRSFVQLREPLDLLDPNTP